ncbi:Retrovirus-related Pol polyprotein from transposon TNT 1-94 [Vitis vinifera]|uniref:Retrovirus-related Pol polyprotein from transposon TNT 1-94 n=1 Tax=Vitis vinifera TaxID=29760 RepID=A0A438K4Z3_VITVI|nr:Retrovirus-related Pol polyprotein from transposon TNT 1-94 [Vitis vinifera]
MIETQYNAKVWVMRSDNGGEYQSYDLQKYLEGRGIIHQTTCSNTPQQNGVAERKNRHLLEVVRVSLIEAKISISCWGEAITSVAYLINRVPSSSINFQTPLQALTNVTFVPTIPNLPPCVFGCMAFVHLHKHQRTKLTSSALQCVFVGYALHKKGYQCYHPLTRPMFITMDVVFHEDSIYFSFESELQGEYQKEIQTLDYNYHIFEEDESGQSELVNQEAVIPNSVQEALADPRWKAAMNEEMKSLQKNETCELVECPPGKKPIWSHWIYTVKYKADGCMVLEKQCQKVCKSKKSLYGLKQSPRAWFGRFTKSMRAFGYRQSNSDHTLFLKKQHAFLHSAVDFLLKFPDICDTLEAEHRKLKANFTALRNQSFAAK